MESDEFVCDFKLLCHERISRARNEHSGDFLNAYSDFGRHQISQHPTPKSALLVDQPGAQALLPGRHPRGSPECGARSPMLLAPAGLVTACALASAQPRVRAEPGSAYRAGLLLHGLLAEAVSPVQVRGGGSVLASRGGSDLEGGEAWRSSSGYLSARVGLSDRVAVTGGSPAGQGGPR